MSYDVALAEKFQRLTTDEGAYICALGRGFSRYDASNFHLRASLYALAAKLDIPFTGGSRQEGFQVQWLKEKAAALDQAGVKCQVGFMT